MTIDHPVPKERNERITNERNDEISRDNNGSEILWNSTFSGKIGIYFFLHLVFRIFRLAAGFQDKNPRY